MTDKYTMTVGLEIHVELKTESKIFCSCPIDVTAAPNTLICPVCMGLPGTLPTLNRRAVEYAVRAGIATNCTVAHRSGIDRKNYFYPDLPKGYQISQYDEPICRGGYLDTACGRVGITRIHVEEDAGKLLHDGGLTLLDCNRCGVPLIEIVSEPDMHSAEHAKTFLRKLRSVIVATGISDCKMNEGSFRCDVNLSVAPKGSDKLGERTEIKNINSFNFVARAIEFEYARQCEMLERGERITRQTLRYDSHSGRCEVMRSKESAIDYRFLPEPDLHEIILSDEDIERIARDIPTLPDEKKRIYTGMLALPEYDAELISSDAALSDYFDKAEKFTKHKKTLANLLISELCAKVEGEEFASDIPPKNIGELAELFASERINSSTAKKLLGRMWNDPTLSPEATARDEELWQINDRDELLKLVEEAIGANPRAVEDYRRGKSFAIRSIIGRVMAASGAKANPRIAEQLILEQISKSETIF